MDDLPVAVVAGVNTSSPALCYAHTDHLGRPARMTAPNWSWVWDVIYAPFGATSFIWTNLANIDLRFPGQWFQLESGLAYNWHRHYDPTIGRYIQPDPLGLKALLSDGPSVYAYVGGNPLAKVDPNGLETVYIPWDLPSQLLMEAAMAGGGVCIISPTNFPPGGKKYQITGGRPLHPLHV
jgi:RHS repeat-associated protein